MIIITINGGDSVVAAYVTPTKKRDQANDPVDKFLVLKVSGIGF